MWNVRRTCLIAAISGSCLGGSAFASPPPGGEHAHGSEAVAPLGAEQLGEVTFQISCSPAVQQRFERGVALLHSFWYDAAHREFSAITQSDPNCAMAYWGIAMSLYHPLWEVPDERSLQQGWAALEQAQRVGAKTAREQDYIAALATFYRDGQKRDHATRVLAYEQAMEELHRRYPEDREAAVFYALSMLGAASPTDKTYARQKKAGELLERLWVQAPNHPGIAHYIVHAYDYPELAARALPAARKYAQIAPASPHALHMPSHIFIRLGLWPESVQSNLASAAAARAYAERVHPGAASFEELHALDYLMYAYLQAAQDRQARGVLQRVREIGRTEPQNFASAYALLAVPARYALERHRWSEAAALTLQPSDFPWERFPWAVAIVHHARALGHAHNGNLDGARQEVDALESIHQSLVRGGQTYWADQVEIQRREAAAWLAHAEGDTERAVALMRSAAELEESTEKHPVTPGAVLPARELLGDMLLAMDQPDAALREYQLSLRSSPRRFNSLHGAAQASARAGDETQANVYYAQLADVARDAESDRIEVRTTRTSAAR